MFEISDLKEKKLPDLQEIAQSLGMKKTKTLKKEELIHRIIDFQAENPSLITPAKQSLPKQKEKKTKTPKNNPIPAISAYLIRLLYSIPFLSFILKSFFEELKYSKYSLNYI